MPKKLAPVPRRVLIPFDLFFEWITLLDVFRCVVIQQMFLGAKSPYIQQCARLNHFIVIYVLIFRSTLSAILFFGKIHKNMVQSKWRPFFIISVSCWVEGHLAAGTKLGRSCDLMCKQNRNKKYVNVKTLRLVYKRVINYAWASLIDLADISPPKFQSKVVSP